jgi:putative glutamine amidotransferase
VKIGLTRTENPEKHQFYIDWLKGNDPDIEVVSLSADDNNPVDIKKYDALVLSGGIDIHPEFYGGSNIYQKAPEKGWNKERDQFEISTLETALDTGMPVLGVCRGLQLINVAMNGSLIQDLGKDLCSAHEGNPDKSHTIHIEPGTVLYDITGANKTQINSAHHQAIDKPGKGLIINAQSAEGIAEGIEWAEKEGKPFLLAIQWHPERMFRFDLQDAPASKAIRDRFIAEIKKSKESKP